jgi:hypothetical protein
MFECLSIIHPKPGRVLDFRLSAENLYRNVEMDSEHLAGRENTAAGVAALHKLMHSNARRLSSVHVYFLSSWPLSELHAFFSIR